MCGFKKEGQKDGRLIAFVFLALPAFRPHQALDWVVALAERLQDVVQSAPCAHQVFSKRAATAHAQQGANFVTTDRTCAESSDAEVQLVLRQNVVFGQRGPAKDSA